VLQSDTGTVVIDCGEKGDGKKITGLLEESGRTTIDYLIITHFDKDHVGGAAKVLNSFEVKNVLTPDYEGTVDEYDKFCKVRGKKRSAHKTHRQYFLHSGRCEIHGICSEKDIIR
ncbi:MBL fold metallo-hydrolase, partial [Ruminococcus flavefaciens]|uniref:MBL fold metallo-hydrolase n=1 Tax=Ruminococcus flavefaciens TaxID=1265 RepID=UPI00047536FE